jgi:hypothetical protein
MSNEKKPKKKSAAPSKEHQQPWQEKYASPEEIQRMLSERVLLRYNDVRHRTELHLLSQPFDHDAIFAQAYALYRQGFRYWFDRPEIERLQRHNEQFETPQSELELVDLHFRKPTANEPRELISATMALQLIGGNLALTLSKEKIGQAFMRLGFEYRRKSAQRGYIAVHRTGVEMEQYRRFLAEERTVTDDGMTAVW